ncbi:MAG TPA: glycosyltransferase, partial [Anaerolineae bacterium]|nr:glycosyltransferase [Anaerolineae bacterium]
MPPLLSVIIPAFNEEHRLPDNLKRILDFLGTQTYASEVVVVDNGSQDRTSAIVDQFMQGNPSLHLIREPA